MSSNNLAKTDTTQSQNWFPWTAGERKESRFQETNQQRSQLMKASKEQKIKIKKRMKKTVWVSRNRDKMSTNRERVGEISQPPPQPQPPPLPPRASSGGMLRTRADPLLVVCRCFSVLTSLTALLCLAINVLSAIRSFKNGSDVRVFMCPSFYFCSSVVFGF